MRQRENETHREREIQRERDRERREKDTYHKPVHTGDGVPVGVAVERLALEAAGAGRRERPSPQNLQNYKGGGKLNHVTEISIIFDLNRFI